MVSRFLNDSLEEVGPRDPKGALMNAPTGIPLAHRLMLLLPISVVLLVLDQWSKVWAVANLAGRPPRTYATIFTLTYAENMGAWGGLGSAWAGHIRWLVLGLLPAAVLLGLIVYALRDEEITSWDIVACALVVAGGVGNLLDRFRLGYVQDFLYVGYGRIGTNIFNIADAVVMAGLGILLVRNLMLTWMNRDKKA